MRIKFFLAILGLSATFLCRAQEKRALIIAIDKYTPPADYQPTGTSRSKFMDLEGCVNDGRSIQSVVTSRFQFPADQVDTLYNEAASRAGVFKAMNTLLTNSKPGDIAFIYYAGHGSQVPNSLSKKEADKKDESMVPSDTWKPNVEDIRDKELAKMYNRFIDKKVILTVIMDCCHSGSLSRGPQDPGKFRYMEDANYDAKDPSDPAIPEERKDGNFLIISAAQDNEFAQEQQDEHNMPHGAFTIAFLQALEQQSVNASALNLFTGIRAILKSNGKKQEPVLGGNEERQHQTLFGLAIGSVPDKSLIAVSGIDNTTNKVLLQGGFALGLYKENELAKIRGKDTLVRLRIDTVLGVNKSLASFIKGNVKDIKPGELLEVTNWVSSAAPLLKVYIPESNMSAEEIAKLAAINYELKKSSKIRWINDLEKTDPYTTIYYEGNKWKVNNDGKNVPVAENITAPALLQLCKKDSSLYFELPPSKDLAAVIREKFRQNPSIVIVKRSSDANYVLYGTINDEGKPSYGLRRAQTSARDSLESMPVQTKSFVLDNSTAKPGTAIAEKIYEYAMRLSKIRGWLQLVSPKDGNKSFQYHLELMNTQTNKPVTGHQYTIGDKVSFHLVADKDNTGASAAKRYIYIFLIDKEGNMTLGYPDPDGGNVGNQFPKYDNEGTLVRDVLLFEGDVAEPVGTDNYFLLASDEPIANFKNVFSQAGVRGVIGDVNPLSNLLNLGNEGGTRGFYKSVSNWNLIRLSMKSTY